MDGANSGANSESNEKQVGGEDNNTGSNGSNGSNGPTEEQMGGRRGRSRRSRRQRGGQVNSTSTVTMGGRRGRSRRGRRHRGGQLNSTSTVMMGGSMPAVGSHAEVWHGSAKHTSGGLVKHDLMKNKHGRIVSRKKHALGKKALKNLVKAGFKAKKGTFKLFRK